MCILNRPPISISRAASWTGIRCCGKSGPDLFLQEATIVLEDMGINGRDISQKICMAEGRTISQMVLDIRKEGQFGTVVTGKRGVSKAEEFLFGSISNALARHSRDFTAWIVG